MTATDKNAHRLALRWLRKPHVKKFVEEVRLVRTKQAEATTQNRTKEQLVRELNALADSVHDPKLKADLLKQIADLERMKEKEPVTMEKERRTFFLPWKSKCRGCRLMQMYRDIMEDNNRVGTNTLRGAEV